jgi:hypothetical protein
VAHDGRAGRRVQDTLGKSGERPMVEALGRFGPEPIEAVAQQGMRIRIGHAAAVSRVVVLSGVADMRRPGPGRLLTSHLA